MSDKFIFTDRYQALGIPYPDPKTMCKGQCEGIGCYPHKLGSEGETGYEQLAWQNAHAESHSEPCDGWHFIPCPDCGGTGKAGGGEVMKLTAKEKAEVRAKAAVIEAIYHIKELESRLEEVKAICREELSWDGAEYASVLAAKVMQAAEGKP